MPQHLPIGLASNTARLAWCGLRFDAFGAQASCKGFAPLLRLPLGHMQLFPIEAAAFDGEVAMVVVGIRVEREHVLVIAKSVLRKAPGRIVQGHRVGCPWCRKD